MSNFIIEEFSFYKIFIYNNQSEKNADASIQIKLDSGMAYIHFMRNSLPPNHVEDKGQLKNFHVYVSYDKFPDYVDIMRYEKPMFFYYNEDDQRSYITTSDEPVGEEERSED
ncbi:MAG: hypothetical protein HKN67_09645 [Saprospiraceae bacterium]|nr:hypothetical protein [Bacteroidia bacterium]MBT8228616.1 hypothetical protein [Bacteroidia bacterium]NNF22195.1 hypothetical protein [Saprospiraceae bacterium]NNK89339.1 hypothetical protein [Saprospiraceae bacterium]